MDCSSGKFSAIASASCTTAGAGKYANGLKTDEVPCAVGTSSTGGGDSCALCSAGTYSKVEGSAFCSYCPGGQIPNGGRTDCVLCSAGKFSSIGDSSCTDCQAGLFSGSGAGTCLYCSPGKYSASRASSCALCAEGAISSTGASQCDPCAAGKYSSIVSIPPNTCLPCDAGTFSSAGSRICDSTCPAGTYGSIGATQCNPCPAGRYAAAGASGCEICLSGKYSGAVAASCSNCDVGKFSISGSTTCTSCDAGSTAAIGSASCNVCAGGTIPSPDWSTCATCAAGKYSSSGQTLCSECIGGTFSSAGSNGCSLCVSGTSSVDGSAACSDCAAGKRSGTGAAMCAVCEGGKYSGPKADLCIACDAGKFSGEGSPSCSTSCPVGTYAGVGATTCESCQPGRYAGEGEAICSICDPGTFSGIRAEACANCDVGKHSGAAASVCVPCDSTKGYVASKAGSIECEYCGPGTMASIITNTCELCIPSKYSAGGNNTCTSCIVEGTYTEKFGASYCTTAKAGWHVNSIRTDDVKCEENFFSTGAADICSVCGNGGHSKAGEASCSFCEPGTFYSASEATCLPCAPGRYSTTGAPSESGCEVCEGAGKYSSSGSSYCAIVKAGYRVLGDRTGVEQCQKNTYSVGGADTCTDCPTEAHSSIGAYNCEVCNTGRYFDESGSKCIDCEVGTYSVSGARSKAGCLTCDDGFFTSEPKAGYCLPCPKGRFSASDHASCESCGPGTFSVIASSQCYDCEAGKYNDEDEKEGCKSCPSNQNSTVGSIECDCNALSGFIGNGAKGKELECFCPPGFTFDSGVCFPCQAGTFKVVNGTEPCKSCGKRAVLGAVFTDFPASSPYSCSCSKGDFRYLYEGNDDIHKKEGFIGECMTCGEGMDCSAPGITLETLPLKKGYWRSGAMSYNVVHCYTLDACPQNNDKTANVTFFLDVDDQCREGHEGPICNVCIDGYVKNVLGLCDICEDTVVPTNFVVVVIVAVVLSLLVIAAYGRRRRRLAKERSRKSRESNLSRSAASAESSDDKSPKSVSERLHAAGMSGHNQKSWFQKFRTKFKILTSFYQISSQFESVLNIRFPKAFEEFGRMVSSIANLDALHVAKVGCIVHTDFYTKLLVSTLGPIAVSLVIFLFSLLFYLSTRSKDSRDAIVDAAMSLFLSLTYMVFASVSTTVFDTFNCERYGDDETFYMASDQSISCDDPTHKKYQGFAYVMIAVYPVGIPLLYFLLLYRNRKALQQEDRVSNASLTKISFLWDMYEPEMWWFEVFDCFRRLSLTGLLIFVFRGKASQIVVAMVIASFSVVAFVHLKPYLKDENVTLAIVSQVSIFFTLLAALLKRVNVDKTDKYDQTTFGYLLIFVNVIGVGMVVSGFFVKPIRRLLRALASKHIHTSEFRGRPDENGDAGQLLSHFQRVATSTNEEAGWLTMTPRDLQPAISSAHDWLDSTEAVCEWRCSTGDGPIDECRVTFTIDAKIEDVWKYTCHGQANHDWDRTVVELATLKDEAHKKTMYYAVKFPFPLSKRDYLWERFVAEKGNEKIVCSRSIYDENLAPLKRSHKDGRVRAHLYVGGYFISRAGANGETTKIVYAVNSELHGVFALDLIRRRVAPIQLVNKVNEFRTFAEVMAGPAPPPGYRHPLSFMWTHEGPLEYPYGKRSAPKASSSSPKSILNKLSSLGNSEDHERGSSFFDVFSGFAGKKILRTESGSEAKTIASDKDEFELENPLFKALREQLEKDYGSKKDKTAGEGVGGMEMATISSSRGGRGSREGSASAAKGNSASGV